MEKQAVDVLHLSSVGTDIELLTRCLTRKNFSYKASPHLEAFLKDLDNYKPRIIVMAGKIQRSYECESEPLDSFTMGFVPAMPHLENSRLIIYSSEDGALEMARQRGLEFYDRTDARFASPVGFANELVRILGERK
ncbi:MAG: hypothetical protein Q7R87_00900 [Nanoarchaeota archaeon]|nr:hypothetical protein [Nanoarchaeota archaeon]